MRDSIAAGMNDMRSPDQSPPNDEFAQMEDGLNMPSYYNPETKDNYDDLIQSSFIQQERSNSFNSKEGQMHDIYAGTTNADSNYFKNVSALNQTQIERIQDLIEQMSQGHDFRMMASTKDSEMQTNIQKRNYSQQTDQVVRKAVNVQTDTKALVETETQTAEKKSIEAFCQTI